MFLETKKIYSSVILSSRRNKVVRKNIINKNIFSQRRKINSLIVAIMFAWMFRSDSNFAKQPKGESKMNSKKNDIMLRKAYADGTFGQIHYRFSGKKESTNFPLICLHPSPLSGIVYDNWLIEMGKDRFSLAPDTPGYGGSDTPKSPPSIGDFSDAMIAFMNSLGLDRVDIMGYHTGSLTSADLALRFPERIRKIVMISAPVFDDEIIKEYSSRINKPAPAFADALAQTAENIREKGKDMFRDVPTDERYEDFSIERIRHFRTTNWGFRAAFSYNFTDALSKVQQPILILNPEDDLWHLTPLAEPFLNDGKIHNLPGWTHGHLDAYTKEMASIVREFLDN